MHRGVKERVIAVNDGNFTMSAELPKHQNTYELFKLKVAF